MAPPVKKKKKHSSADHRSISATDANQQKPLGSFMTFGKRQSVRVAMKMNRRILRKILLQHIVFHIFSWVCNDIWMDTLPFFGRRQLGLKLAMVSPRFNALVDKHFDGQTELTIWRPIKIAKMKTATKLVVRNGFGNSKYFPLPDRSLHNKIRFEDIWISFIDHSVITFLRSNQQIFDKRGTSMDLLFRLYAKDKDTQPIWNAFAAEIWPIFAPNIRHLKFNGDLENLRRHISPTILSDLNQLNSINSDTLGPTAIGDDGPNATDGQALSKWLHTPTKDGQPKQLSFWHFSECGTTKLLNDFKEAFLHATTSSASYIIRIKFEFSESSPIESFELVNERTNEKLTLEKKDEYAYGNWTLKRCQIWLLKRCQIGGTIHWKDEKTDNLNKVFIILNGGTDCIGPLSPPAEADPMDDLMNPGPSSGRKSERIMAKLKND